MDKPTKEEIDRVLDYLKGLSDREADPIMCYKKVTWGEIKKWQCFDFVMREDMKSTFPFMKYTDSKGWLMKEYADRIDHGFIVEEELKL